MSPCDSPDGASDWYGALPPAVCHAVPLYTCNLLFVLSHQCCPDIGLVGAEVFEKLDTTASKTEEWISKYQNFIIAAIGIVAVSVLSYLGYQSYIFEPKKLEAVSELSQAQYYFELAVNGQEPDSLFRRALNGGEGKYGFLDIIDNMPNKYMNQIRQPDALFAYAKNPPEPLTT